MIVKKVITNDRENKNENHSDLPTNGNNVERTGGMVSPGSIINWVANLKRMRINQFNS